MHAGRANGWSARPASAASGGRPTTEYVDDGRAVAAAEPGAGDRPVEQMPPAPRLARRHRWARADNLRRSCWRVVHVVTAFAIGHSLTLALGAFGFINVPTRLVEA